MSIEGSHSSGGVTPGGDNDHNIQESKNESSWLGNIAKRAFNATAGRALKAIVGSPSAPPPDKQPKVFTAQETMDREITAFRAKVEDMSLEKIQKNRTLLQENKSAILENRNLKDAQAELKLHRSEISEEVLNRIGKEVADEMNEKMELSSEDPDFSINADGSIEGYLPLESKKAYEELYQACLEEKMMQHLISRDIGDSSILQKGLESSSLLKHTQQKEAVLMREHALNIAWASDYSRDGDSDLTKQLESYVADFGNKEDIDIAKEFIREKISSFEEKQQALLEGKTPKFTSDRALLNQLYSKFHINPEDGTRATETPLPEDLDRWEKGIEAAINRNESGQVLLPCERRLLAINKLQTLCQNLNHMCQNIEEGHLLLEGNRVALGTECTLMIGDKEVSCTLNVDDEKISGAFVMSQEIDYDPTIEDIESGKDGIIYIRKGDPDVNIDGYVISFPNDADRPIITLKEGEIFNPADYMKEVRIGSEVHQTSSSIILKDYIEHYGIDKASIEKFSENLDLVRERTEAEIPKELVEHQKALILEKCHASDAQKEAIATELKILQEKHFHALSDDIDKERLVNILEKMDLHQARSDNFGSKEKGYASQAASGVYSAAEKVAGYFKSASMEYNNVDKIKEFDAKITTLSAEIETLKEQLKKFEEDEDAAGVKGAQSKIINKQIEITKLKQAKLWFRKSSLTQVMSKVIQATSVNNTTNEALRPKDYEKNNAILDKAYFDLSKELRSLERDEESILQEHKDLLVKSAQTYLLDSFSNILSFGTSILKEELGDYFYGLPTSDEMALRKHQADVGYNMLEELNTLKNDIMHGLGNTGSPRDFLAKLKDKAESLARFMLRSPEQASRLVADIGQIKDILGNSSLANTFASRIHTQTLSKVFLEGVKENREERVSDAEFRKMQAISDALRVLVPLVGAAKGAAEGDQSWAGWVAGKLPVVGPVASRLTGAIWGAFSNDYVRHNINRMSDDTRAEAFGLVSAIKEGVPGYLEAHAKLDATRIAGETTKALLDKGNIFTSGIKRFFGGVAHTFKRNFYAMTNMIKSPEAPLVDKIVGVLSLAAPIAGAVLGILSLASIVAAPIAAVLVPLFFGASYGVSKYARIRGYGKGYDESHKRSNINKYEKKLLKDKEAKEKIESSADVNFHRKHALGHYDKRIQEHISNNLNDDNIDEILEHFVTMEKPQAFEKFKASLSESFKAEVRDQVEMANPRIPREHLKAKIEQKFQAEFYKQELVKKLFEEIKKEEVKSLAHEIATIHVEEGADKERIMKALQQEQSTANTEDLKRKSRIEAAGAKSGLSSLEIGEFTKEVIAPEGGLPFGPRFKQLS